MRRVAALLTAAVVAVFMLTACETDSSEEEKIVTACRTAEKVIKDSLRSPSSADFTGNCWRADGRGGSGYIVTRMAEGEHRWKIELDAENAYGAMIRTTCIAETTIGTSSARARLVSCDSR